MKNYKILFIGLLLLIGCENNTATKNNMVIVDNTTIVYDKGILGIGTGNIYFTIIVIDSCEYITGKFGYNSDPLLIHRGRCKFCEQRKLNK